MNSDAFVSIILPIRNEAKYISSSLSSVINQDYPFHLLEIIIVDGMSNDGTRDIIQKMKNDDARITIIDNPGRIVPTGLNRAIQKAKGDIIIRVDGHTRIARDYVRTCVELIERTGAENVGGRMDGVGNTEFGSTVCIATSTPFGVGGSRFHYSKEEEEVDTVYLGAWPKRVFSNIGLFDEEMVRDQDDEFNYRLREHGGKIILSPTIKSKYTVRSTPKGLWKQYFQYGLWKVRVLQKHPRQMSLRQFVPPAFVLALITTSLCALISQWGWILLSLIISCYLVANFAASIYTATRNGLKYLLLLPITFAIMHLSYGLGLLFGFVKFWNRWRDKKGKVPELSL